MADQQWNPEEIEAAHVLLLLSKIRVEVSPPSPAFTAVSLEHENSRKVSEESSRAAIDKNAVTKPSQIELSQSSNIEVKGNLLTLVKKRL